jgi:serine/threonine-protein kinase
MVVEDVKKESEKQGSSTLVCAQCGTAVATSEEGVPSKFCVRCQLPQFLVSARYKLLRKLGEGGAGVVFLAEDTREEGAQRVLKFLANGDALEGSAQKRFQQEVEMTVSLSSQTEHIVRAYDDFGFVPELGTYYVMEFVDGLELSQWLPAHFSTSTLAQRCDLFRQLLEAVTLMHAEDIIHRDLKPQNILISERADGSFHLKLADFGAARHMSGERLTKSASTLIGTPMYMAPEQFVSSRVDEASDLYALGLILYELLVGAHPFSRSIEGGKNTMMQAASAHMYHEPPPFSTFVEREALPEAMESLVMQALSKAPHDRMPSILHFQRDFARICQDELPIEEHQPEWQSDVDKVRALVQGDSSQLLHTVLGPASQELSSIRQHWQDGMRPESTTQELLDASVERVEEPDDVLEWHQPFWTRWQVWAGVGAVLLGVVVWWLLGA